MGWLTKFLSGGEVENRAGLSAGKLAFLAQDLLRLENIGAGLGRRALKYVADGEGADALLALSGKHGGGRALKLECVEQSYHIAGTGRRDSFYRGLTVEDAGASLRLAQVYEAASRQEQRQLHGQSLGFPVWLEVFLVESIGQDRFVFPPQKPSYSLDIRLLEEMLREDDEPTAHVVRGALLADPHQWDTQYVKNLLTELEGFAECVLRHPDVIREALAAPARVKVEAIELMRDKKVDLRSFTPELLDLAVGSAKTARDAVESLLLEYKEQILPIAREKATAGSPTKRDLAVRLLLRIDPANQAAFVSKRREEETSQKIRQTIDELLEARTAVEVPAERESFDMPPLPTFARETPLPPETLEALVVACDKRNEAAEALYKKNRSRMSWLERPAPIPRSQASRAFELLQSFVFEGTKNAGLQLEFRSGWSNMDEQLVPFLERPELELVHFVRLMHLIGEIAFDQRPHVGGGTRRSGFFIGYNFDRYCRIFRRSHPPAFGLRELASVFTFLGLDPNVIGWEHLTGATWHHNFQWEDDAVSPYFAERTALLEEVFEVKPSAVRIETWMRLDVHRNAYKVLGALPSIPASLVPRLWEIALGTSKRERPLAQEALASVPGKEKKIVAALKNGKQDIRASAADWLGRIGSKEAIPAITRALEKEKKDIPKGAMMSALEQLGVPIEQFLDRDRLLEEATKGLASPIPQGLSWFPFDLMPEVTWADTGQPVSPDILEWVVLQNVKLKSPEPGPLLRRYCSYFDRGEAESFGQFVLDAWITHDTRIPPAGSINWGRVLIGGLAAGLLINVSEAILNAVVLEAPFAAAMEEMGKTMDMGGGAIAVWMLWGFAVGITTVWLYAAIRPRYGAGLKTALCAGATVWFLATFLFSVAMVNMGLFAVGLMATGTVWALVEMLIAAALGAWLYKEDAAGTEA